jgi:alkanesulfonate monooxygenase SsuD/methylene tetrahydromethanopterin reductase-like flavin-dependent oxidoreductase (luciferase family)
MQFGVFDHMDSSGEPLAQLFENRLKLAEAYDRMGLYALHVAEHHSTPLGMSPSPSVFLALAVQRTRRLEESLRSAELFAEAVMPGLVAA